MARIVVQISTQKLCSPHSKNIIFQSYYPELLNPISLLSSSRAFERWYSGKKRKIFRPFVQIVIARSAHYPGATGMYAAAGATGTYAAAGGTGMYAHWQARYATM